MDKDDTTHEEPTAPQDEQTAESSSSSDTPSSQQDDQQAPDTPAEESTSLDEDTPSDALSRTPEDLDQEKAQKEEAPAEPTQPIKKQSKIKRFFKRINVYFLFFGLLLVVAGAITIVNYINNQKANPTIDIATQELADKTLEQLANTDVSVGNNAQTLTIQGNAIIAGQTLMRGSASIAGNLQVGGAIQSPSITISGAASLGQTQTQTLQVQNTLAVQGGTTLRDLTVSGGTTFSGPVTANQLTVTRLILSGNATLEVPNHIGFTGPTPGRGALNYATLGSGGTLSLSGSDTAGVINIQTGNNTSAGCFAQINFNQQFTRQPRVIISPVSEGAGQLQYYVNRSASGFSICTANAAPANKTFAFDYFVTN